MMGLFYTMAMLSIAIFSIACLDKSALLPPLFLVLHGQRGSVM